MKLQVLTETLGDATKSSTLFLGFKLPSDQCEERALEKTKKLQKCIKKQGDTKPNYIEINVDPLRSPEAMIFYMGELIETQLKSAGHYLPELLRDEDEPSKERPIFKVIKGRPSGGAAVKVSHEGETYAIPREGAGRSMSVMSLVSLIFGLHREADELPTTPTLKLIGQ